jgi:hypothetical protein
MEYIFIGVGVLLAGVLLNVALNGKHNPWPGVILMVVGLGMVFTAHP